MEIGILEKLGSGYGVYYEFIFGFDNSDEKACGWCDFKFICHEGVLGKNKNLEESV